MSVEFDTPANRIIAQQQPKNQFRIDNTLPDISFLRQLSIQGRLRYFQATGTVTIIPANGETFFFYRAEMFNSHASAASTVTISNNGMTRWEMVIPPISAGVLMITEFLDSLVGDSIKTFTITPSGGTVRVSAFGWVENTSRIRDVSI